LLLLGVIDVEVFGVLLRIDNQSDKAAFEDVRSEAQFIISESEPNADKNVQNEISCAFGENNK
jgi:hypothetical protein